MTRRRLVVKAVGPETHAIFYIEARRGKVRITCYDCPHVCEAILETAQADSLVALINQTTTEARGYKNDPAL